MAKLTHKHKKQRVSESTNDTHINVWLDVYVCVCVYLLAQNTWHIHKHSHSHSHSLANNANQTLSCFTVDLGAFSLLYYSIEQFRIKISPEVCVHWMMIYDCVLISLSFFAFCLCFATFFLFFSVRVCKLDNDNIQLTTHLIRLFFTWYCIGLANNCQQSGSQLCVNSSNSQSFSILFNALFSILCFLNAVVVFLFVSFMLSFNFFLCSLCSVVIWIAMLRKEL